VIKKDIAFVKRRNVATNVDIVEFPPLISTFVHVERRLRTPGV